MAKLVLRDFQKEDVRFIQKNNYRVLVANAPGTGKTIECLACLHLDRKKLTPTIVVCPPSVSHNWRRETKKWCPWAKVYIVKGWHSPLPKKHIDVIIMPWSVLAHRYAQVIRRNPRLLIVDEAHFAKNEDTLRSQALQRLARATPHLLLLTGTPLINNEREFEVLKELFGQEPPVLRRLLEDVAKDIPPKTRSVIPVQMGRRFTAEYKKAEEDFEEWLEKELQTRLSDGEAVAAAHRAMAAEALVKIGYLRRLLAKAKSYAAAEWIGNAVLTGEPVVVFLEHQEPLKMLSRSLRQQRIRHVIVDGSTKQKDRSKAVDAFQSGLVPVFIGTKAAKEGITLHRARHLLFLERFFTSADEEQAEDRIRRIGQKYPTTIWFLHAVGTIDDRLEQIINTKRRLVDSVIGSADIDQNDEASVLEMISSWATHAKREKEVTDLGLGNKPPALPNTTTVCRLLFSTSRWSKKSAKIWATMNGYNTKKITRTAKLITVENIPANAFRTGSFKSSMLTEDIQVVIGKKR
jgi:SNF2 family DNA or RNA helicase